MLLVINRKCHRLFAFSKMSEKFLANTTIFFFNSHLKLGICELFSKYLATFPITYFTWKIGADVSKINLLKPKVDPNHHFERGIPKLSKFLRIFVLLLLRKLDGKYLFHHSTLRGISPSLCHSLKFFRTKIHFWNRKISIIGYEIIRNFSSSILFKNLPCRRIYDPYHFLNG